MKTSSSFFPTNTHTNLQQHHQDRTYNILRKTPNDNHSYRTIDHQSERHNIFRQINQYPKKYSVQQPNPRPIGGLELFQRMEQLKDRHNQHRKNSKKNNIESSQLNITSSSARNRFRRQRLQTQGSVATDKPPTKQIRKSQPCQFKEQQYKAKYNYFAQASSFKLRTQSKLNKNIHKSEFMLRPKSESKVVLKSKAKTKTQMQEEWADEQSKAYHDKMAIINQINHNRPLVQVYGDQYFQFTLRNRFEDDSKPPAYLYLIKDKFSDAKIINKLRSTYIFIYD